MTEETKTLREAFEEAIAGKRFREKEPTGEAMTIVGARPAAGAAAGGARGNHPQTGTDRKDG
jgi:hypothetical protein